MQGSKGVQERSASASAAMRRLSRRRAVRRRVPIPVAGSARQVCLRAALAVANDFGIDVCRLYARGRGGGGLALARQMAMYLAHITVGLAVARVGDGFGRHSTTVYHACSVVEERREDPYVDRELTRLEARLVGELTGEARS